MALILKILLCFCLLPGLSATSNAISVGHLTFSMAADKKMISKYVVNNNEQARLYRISITAIDRPGEHEIRHSLTDGQLLFSPRQITLQPGEGNFFKFYYRGPQDNIERYYRVAFAEIPPQNRLIRSGKSNAVSIMPVIVLETILVVRPRQVNFKWDYDSQTGVVKNSGNTWFKLLAKPHCETKEEDSEAWYLRPGESVRHDSLRGIGGKFIIYNDKFINITDDCR
ncbi:fimbrial biogenesis chaperone [Kosakonia sacchari]|uniref:fimbrial biogenesis chaperone n=1 Tax=Kosakonia sacchari TaxID=1158459 RepID=UPI000BE5E7EC|nr:fimbria/pilus periplasmic chaperone [Kosakonia sacchari]PDO87927.1 hypothetical protein BK797_06960 [Kosakonia sacchari]QHM96191.1 molecular chaperone [Kosakonia sacchari]